MQFITILHKISNMNGIGYDNKLMLLYKLIESMNIISYITLVHKYFYNYKFIKL
jgi:hypothetical protein